MPRTLLLDRRLTPLERNAWQIFRLQLEPDGLTAFPTYARLQPLLASQPCGPLASHETIARTLTLLRLTRWLSLIRRRRDPITGQILGNVYVLHDDPLTPFEAMQLDPTYLALLGKALDHSAAAVRRVALHVLDEIAEDPMLHGRILPTRLQLLSARLQQRAGKNPSHPQDIHVPDSEEGLETPLRTRESPSSDPESGRKPAPDCSVRNPKMDSTVGMYKEIPTGDGETCARVPPVAPTKAVDQTREATPASQTFRMPACFTALPATQQPSLLAALQQLDEPVRQQVLDEWAARCGSAAVRHPAGYLLGIVHKAIRGDFRAWAAPRAPPGMETVAAVQPGREASTARSPAAQAHLDRLREMLGRR